MENEKGSGSSKDLKTHPNGDPLSKSEKKSLSRSSSSSSSSKSFDLDEKDGVDQSKMNMVSASPRSGTGHSPKTPPPIQVMDQPNSYDSKRIPSSVFNSSPKSGMEWSVTSNESLFSIHMGNTSFSREHLMTKSGELINSPSYNNLISLPPNLATVNETVRSCNDSYEECQTPKMGSKKESGDKEKTTKMEPPHHVLTSPPRLSDGSGNSSKSFAFPVLAGDSSARHVPETPSMAAQARRKAKLDQETEPNPEPKAETNQEKNPKSASTAQNKWFPCLSCCPFCC